MNKLLILPVIALAGCASMQPAPHDIEDIHQATHQRITYQNYAKKDWRYIPAGQQATGNCAVFAYTNLIDLTEAGYKPSLRICRTKRGVVHAYTQVDQWALDNRFKWVIPMNQQDCQ